MGVLARLLAWLRGAPNIHYRKRATIGGVAVEKFYVFAQGREALLEEMCRVMGDPRFQIAGEEQSGFKSATEEWRLLDGEDEAAAIRRIAHEIAAKHPGMSVLAFAWPGSRPTLVAAIVTVGEYTLPFAAEHLCRSGRP